jgi:hypothetical protein
MRGSMRRKKGNKFLNAKPGYGHRQMEITREQGQAASRSKNWHTAGLIWRTLARNPEGLFAHDVPLPEERRRREILLARLLVITLEMLLSEEYINLGVRIETAKDMIREFKHVYPEAMDV